MSRSTIILAIIFTLVTFAPSLATDPMATNPTAQMQAPSWKHLLGTDFLGRDLLSRLLYGGQRTLIISAAATVTAVLPGVIVGLWAGWLNENWSQFFRTVTNAIIAFPGLLLALVVMTLFGRGILPLIMAVGIAQIVPCILVTRAAVMSVRSSTHVEAALALGATRWRVTRYHILPNIRASLLAYIGIVFAYSVANGAALSFLGLGGEPGVPDWGVMLAESRATFRTMPLTAAIPGGLITLTVLAINDLADRLSGEGTIRKF